MREIECLKRESSIGQKPPNELSLSDALESKSVASGKEGIVSRKNDKTFTAIGNLPTSNHVLFM